MSSLNVFEAAMDMTGPPGLTHPLLVENYAWVDERLREMYYGYALTDLNSDEYEEAGLLKEHYDWVDRMLATPSPTIEDELRCVPCPMPLSWGYFRNGANLESLEPEILEDDSSCEKRERSESDISDYQEEADRVVKRLRCQSPIPTGTYEPLITNPCYNLDCDRLNTACFESGCDESIDSHEFDDDSDMDDDNWYWDQKYEEAAEIGSHYSYDSY